MEEHNSSLSPQEHAAALSASALADNIDKIVADVLEIPDRSLFRIDIAHASVTLIDWWDNRPLLRGLNWRTPRDLA